MLFSPCKKCLVQVVCKEHHTCDLYKEHIKTMKLSSNIQMFIGVAVSFIPLFYALIPPPASREKVLVVSIIFFFLALLIIITSFRKGVYE